MTAKAKRRSKKRQGPVVPQPYSWEDIKVGAIVLASAGPCHCAWHETVVLAIEGETFELRYAECPATFGTAPFAARGTDPCC
jgi:hypothetical protein